MYLYLADCARHALGVTVPVVPVLGGLGGSVQAQGSGNNNAVSTDVKFEANFLKETLATGEPLPAYATFARVAFATHESTVSYFNAGEPTCHGVDVSTGRQGYSAIGVQGLGTSGPTAFSRRRSSVLPRRGGA